ncbi:helix-turn-helix domain-containing protein [Streptomyces sp. NPDC001816]|uniref:helix-turn-helix domain-containing protein n=1 Tax=Streptomyces sp. NPDC001816 TaxID=3364612 RepID=UPI0036C69A3C
MSNQVSNEARVIPLRPEPIRTEPIRTEPVRPEPVRPEPVRTDAPEPAPREPLWRDLVGEVLRRERLAQERTLRDVADEAQISLPYLSEIERGRKEASSEVLAAAARALGLGLGDLLSLAQGELTRHTAAGRRTAAVPQHPYQPYNGLCLVA